MNARATTLLFAAAAFFGAGMLFLVQPMIARLLLPSYGGSATVWSTSSLFFQVVLLLGYLYTDRATRLRPRRQRVLHGLFLVTPLLVLPLALPSNAAPGTDVSPVLWLLRTLALLVGLPFLVLATTGPLIQKWYSWRGQLRSADPYFLFAASNLGSFVGLISYPFLIEPFLALDDQLRLWSFGFGVFVLLTGACMLLPARGSSTSQGPALADGADLPEPATGPVPAARMLRWGAWAFLPSGLMLAVTSHISTDIAAVPLLWVVPLAIYLATFVVAFARTARQPPALVTRIAVLAAVIASVSAVVNVAHQPVLLAIVIQMVMLALVAFASHARLAADRPETSRLTTFYLVVAVGGAVGGLLNGVVAPLLFDRVLEYALLIVVVPLLLLGLRVNRDGVSDEERRRRRVRRLGVALGLLVPAAAIAVAARESPGLLLALLAAGLLAWPLTRSPRLLCVVLVVLQVLLLVASDVDIIDRRRTFYGSYSTKATSDQHILYDGTTLHGTQFLDARSGDPTSYYTRSGPLGDVFGLRRFQDVAVVGLGAGTMAAYGEPGQSMTFDEIDQADVDIARDPHLFTYLADSRADVHVIVGDGRIGLEAAPVASYDLIVLDAFSSDSIPVHLLTREAAAMYTDRLRPGGLLVFHITNHTFDLRPVMRGLMDSLGWVGIVGDRESHDPGATRSTWVVLAPTTQDLDALAHRPGWTPLPARSVSWTDDYSSVLRVLR